MSQKRRGFICSCVHLPQIKHLAAVGETPTVRGLISGSRRSFASTEPCVRVFARQLASFSFDMQSVLARRPRFLIFIHNQQDTQMRWTDSNIILPSVKYNVKNITKLVRT